MILFSPCVNTFEDITFLSFGAPWYIWQILLLRVFLPNRIEGWKPLRLIRFPKVRLTGFGAYWWLQIRLWSISVDCISLWLGKFIPTNVVVTHGCILCVVTIYNFSKTRNQNYLAWKETARRQPHLAY